MSDPLRSIVRRFPGVPTLEGAGVHLRRSFSNNEVPLFDPFLLLDRFGSANPEEYMAGFPWHPHRGIETVTYVLDGRVEHGDTLGNAGVIGPGDVQWMNSGSGIVHQEMPKRSDNPNLAGFQLWVNLPAREKMSVPAYRGLGATDIPEVPTDAGGAVKVVAGSFGRLEGPVRGIPVDPSYFDVRLAAGERFSWSPHAGHTVFAHGIEGHGAFAGTDSRSVASGETVLFGEGGGVEASAGPDGWRFLLVSGRPLHEPVAWYGPIVMNTRSELADAARELRSGEFIKHRRPIVEG
ncbi:MAG TPA: pirin family protein [Thermoplasmata archaeon]|nr:pirin family protein [Thermoplasmata archaeon]